MIESSVDGEAWTEIDRRTDKKDLKSNFDSRVVSFAASTPGLGRFIRLTQTGKTHFGNAFLYIYAFEVFGTLLE
jgi:hypothetical protein